MFRPFAILILVLLFGSVNVQAQGPANVIRTDGTCSIGWFGCPADAGEMLSDGTWMCTEIGLVFIAGDNWTVDPNSAHDNAKGGCSSHIEFGQPNPGGGLGGDVEVIALTLDTVCTFLPDACKGNGAFIANPRTVGSLAVCLVNGVPSTKMQEVVTPSGQVSLVCSLPDPPQGD